MVFRSKQHAGENSVQIVVQGDYLHGVSEERAKEIALDAARTVISEYSEEAASLAGERIEAFDEILIERLGTADLLDAFRDPGFQLSLKRAQIGAATSDAEADYTLLSELLVQRVQRGSERPAKAGIDRAIEVVDKTDPDALRGLTMLQVVVRILPVARHLDAGLDVMERVYGTILADGPLPTGRDWIEHLDILDAVRFDTANTFKPFDEYFASKMPGYIASGAPVDSDELRDGIARLGVFSIMMAPVPHELKPGFVRAPFASITGLNHLLMQVPTITEETRVDIALAMSEFFGLNESGETTLIPKLIERARDRPSIRTVADWWGGLPVHVEATVVGRVLARANAQRCDPSGYIADLEGGGVA